MNEESIAQALLCICSQTNQNLPFLLSKDGRKNLYVFKNTITDSGISSLKYWLHDDEDLAFPPIEVLWFFNEQNLLKLSTFIYFHPEFCEDLVDILVDSIFEAVEEESDLVNQIVAECVGHFINMWKPLEGADNPHVGDFMELFILKVNSRIYSGCQMKQNYLKNILDLGGVVEPQLWQFLIYHYKRLLSHEIESVSMFSVINLQTKQFTVKSMDRSLLQFYYQVFEMVSTPEIIEEISMAVTEHSFNWKVLLTSISVVSTLTTENADLMKDTLDNWFKEAVSNKDRTLLYVCLLASRQCCAESVRHFSNYAGWFGSLQLKTASTFSFFFKSLSEIVPYESALNLKIHVNKVPSAPPSCQSLLIDYLNLAKTRLSDLNETTDYIGLFNDCHNSDVEGQESDIARVIVHFKEMKEVPKAVFEASVFRRQYYEKVFLQRLLSVSEKDDPDRAQIILKLQSMGKIPSSLFSAWKSL